MSKYYGITNIDGVQCTWTFACKTEEEALEEGEAKIIDTCGSKTQRCKEFLNALKVKKVAT
jgi:hypothetical protein